MMIFENLFLEKSDLTRLQLYRDILSIQCPVFKVTDLAKVHGTSYQQAYNNLQSLLKDLNKFYQIKTDEFFDGNEVFRESFTMTLTEYRNHMITETLTFRFIDALFNNEYEDLKGFLDDNFISRSTLSRKTSSLHEYMKHYGIGISYIDMKFVGDEKKIREFLFIFYYSLFMGYKWPFSNVTFSEARSVLNSINNNDFYYLYRNKVDEYQCVFKTAIAMKRIQDGYPISRASRLDLIVQNNKLFNEDKAKSLELFKLSKSYSFNEIEELFFSFNRTISPFNKSNVNDHNLIETFQANNSPLWQFTISYLEMIANKYSDKLSTDVVSDEVLLSNLIRIFYSYYVFMGSYPTISRLFSKEDQNLTGYNALIDVTRNFIIENAGKYEMQDILSSSRLISEDIYQLLLPAIGKILTKDTINVKLYLEDDIMASREITTFLSDLKGIHILNKEDSVEVADVIVTPLGHLDNLPNIVVPEGVKILSWNSESNENEFYRIYREIQQIHIERTNSSEEEFNAYKNEQELA